jgi:hypothetical protein
MTNPNPLHNATHIFWSVKLQPTIFLPMNKQAGKTSAQLHAIIIRNKIGVKFASIIP